MILARKIVVLLFPMLLLAGCLGGTKGEVAKVDASELGKVHIRYYITEADITAPPVTFNVYRSASPSGPFEKVNEKPIEADEGLRRGDMQQLLTDVGLPLGSVFWYFVQKTDAKGVTSKATSTAAATVNLPLQPEDHRALQALAEEQARTKKNGAKSPNQPKLPARGRDNG